MMSEHVTVFLEAGDLARSAGVSTSAVRRDVQLGACDRRTRSVFDRYRIVNNADMAEELARNAEGSASVPPKSRSDAGTVTASCGSAA